MIYITLVCYSHTSAYPAVLSICCKLHNIYPPSGRRDITRAAQEGIVFSFKYGMDIMNEMGIDIDVIRAGSANMFLSPVFRDTLSGVTGTVIELFDTKHSSSPRNSECLPR